MRCVGERVGGRCAGGGNVLDTPLIEAEERHIRRREGLFRLARADSCPGHWWMICQHMQKPLDRPGWEHCPRTDHAVRCKQWEKRASCWRMYDAEKHGKD